MPWRVLSIPRRALLLVPVIANTRTCPCSRASCSPSPEAMLLLNRKVYTNSAVSHNKLPFYAHVWLNERFSTNHYLTSKDSALGSSTSTPCSLVQCSNSCGHVPLQESIDQDVSNQALISSLALKGDMVESELPVLHHSSTFLQLFTSEQEEDDTYALVVLNHDLPLLTLFLWSKASCRICADGGANRIYDLVARLLPHEDPVKVRERYKPDVIKGDLDSIRPEVKEFYAGLGTKILDNSEDQDTTDLWKCVAYASDSMPDVKKGLVKLLVLGALGGRLDHEFANVNMLYLFRTVRLILLSDESMAFLLPKNYMHEILVEPAVEGPYCGLLPLGGPSLSTTTKGLKWELDKSPLQFGGLISTSNMPVSNCVTVMSDADLVWTISLQYLHSRLQEAIHSL